MSTHTCDALVVACIDFRFQKYIRTWTDENFKDKLFDYVGFAGGSKNLDTIMSQVDISVKLHDIKEVYLINHEDCGAYGGEGTPAKHSEDLKKVRQTIKENYPNLKIFLYYLKLDSTFEAVE